MKINLLTLSIFALIFASCEKDEIPVEAAQRGEISSNSVDMGAGYPNQVYFNFDLNGATGFTENTAWDIGLEGGADGYKIILNDARLMSAWKSDSKDIQTASDTLGFGQGKVIENANLVYDQPALGDWRTETPVYLLDLGYNSAGQHLGYYWLQVQHSDSYEYAIAFREMDTEGTATITIPKTEGLSYSLYSLVNRESIQIPTDNDWHIRFTRFTHQFDDPPLAYLVTGVLLNPNSTYAIEVLDVPFDEIDAETVGNIDFTNAPDEIGYDWKFYNFDLASYEVDATRSWVIQTSAGYYYKLRFIDFYSEDGVVGHPQFEFSLI